MSYGSVRKILHKDLNFRLYKMAVVRDMTSRSTVVERLIGILPNDIIILTPDDAHFHLSGSVNKQNFRYWANEDPQLLHQRPLHSAHVTV
jgi:hypothetical protein